jgi:hypothetical protein
MEHLHDENVECICFTVRIGCSQRLRKIDIAFLEKYFIA